MEHDTPITRKRFVVAAGALLAAGTVPRVLNPAIAKAAPPWSEQLFTLGVASGDPTPDSVLLWTRLAPEPLAGGGMPSRSVAVRWEVAHDEAMRHVVRHGVAHARPELAHSVHVDVEGLEPGREYFYRFIAGPQESIVGRTRTAPREHAGGELRFAFVSCQDWQNGYYNAFRRLSEEDVDLIVHLGDYIYEYGPEGKTRPGSPPARVHDGPEVFSLESYRNRHALYKTAAGGPRRRAVDSHLGRPRDREQLRRRHPGGGELASRRLRGAVGKRDSRVLRAPAAPPLLAARRKGPRLYRTIDWGRLAQFHVLDTRQYRTDQPCEDGLKNCEGRFDPAATMTGAEQERWLFRGLASSRARWNVLAQQTIFAEVDFNPVPSSVGPAGLFNVDQWDGYVAQRKRVSQFLADRKPSNPVVITGDIHSSWANDIKLDYDNPASATVASEFVGTSITSDFPAAFIAPVNAALADNPHIRFFDGVYRGYVRCSVTPEQWRTDFRAVASVDVPDAPAFTLRSFVVENGAAGVKPA